MRIRPVDNITSVDIPSQSLALIKRLILQPIGTGKAGGWDQAANPEITKCHHTKEEQKSDPLPKSPEALSTPAIQEFGQHVHLAGK